jgi:hypothetical protein
MPERRGGGDFDLEVNWHGPERKSPENDCRPDPTPAGYQKVAARTIGRWAGDRIAIVGDYATDADLPPEFEAGSIYTKCDDDGEYMDISEDVCRVIEHELNGKYSGTGWREFARNET